MSAIVGDENILFEHHARTQRTPVRRFDPYLQVELKRMSVVSPTSRFATGAE